MRGNSVGVKKLRNIERWFLGLAALFVIVGLKSNIWPEPMAISRKAEKHEPAMLDYTPPTVVRIYGFVSVALGIGMGAIVYYPFGQTRKKWQRK
jgi:uncharacterized membrane protein YfcA